MAPKTHKVLLFIVKIISDKSHFLFWIFIRFISAVFPLVTIYQFSLVVKQLETKSSINTILSTIILLFIIRLIDNYLRLLSTTRLDNVISNISFDIHNFFLSDLKPESKEDRHATIQAIRNFAEASNITLTVFKQPGIDSLVSLLFIPLILLTQDFPAFVFCTVYILIYFFVDLYTTQQYAHLKDILNTKTEQYYGKLQDSNDYDVEQHSWCRHFNRICHWSFKEWFMLQGVAVFFYSFILLSLARDISLGYKDIATLILIVGYISQIQTHLNSFSQIQDNLTDMMVGLTHLAKNNSISTLNLPDLM